MQSNKILSVVFAVFVCYFSAVSQCPDVDITKDEISVSTKGSSWNLTLTSVSDGLKINAKTSSLISSSGTVVVAAEERTRASLSVSKTSRSENFYLECADSVELSQNDVAVFGFYKTATGSRTLTLLSAEGRDVFVAQQSSPTSDWETSCKKIASDDEASFSLLDDIELERGLEGLSLSEDDQLVTENCFPDEQDQDTTSVDSATCSDLIEHACVQPRVWRDSRVYISAVGTEPKNTSRSFATFISKQRRVLSRARKQGRTSAALSAVHKKLIERVMAATTVVGTETIKLQKILSRLTRLSQATGKTRTRRFEALLKIMR